MSDTDDILNKDPEFENNPELRRYLDRLQSLKVPATKSKETAWNEIVTLIEAKEATQVKTISLRRFIPAVAATVAILLVASWLTYYNLNHVELFVEQGNTRSVVLPDKSTVNLNAGSSITYKRWGFTENRKVSMQGEAFFDVKTSGSFIVEADSKTIEVLGTSFNVYSRGVSFRVQCLTGKVKVDIKNIINTILSPGQAVKSIPGDVMPEIYTVDSLRTASWTRGEFWFDAEPLSSVLDEIERQFSIAIEFSGNNERLYTGYFNHNDLETALENVCIPLSLRFEITGPKKVKIW